MPTQSIALSISDSRTNRDTFMNSVSGSVANPNTYGPDGFLGNPGESTAHTNSHADDSGKNLFLGNKHKLTQDDFNYIKVIGRGSFGKVYLVKKLDNQKFYAMKILKKEQLVKKNLLLKT